MATNAGALLVPPRPTAPAPAAVAVTNDLRPIRPPVPIANPWVWFWWGLLLALVAGLAVGLWLWRRKQRPGPPPPPAIPPHLRARHRLAKALQHISDPRRFCIEVSDAIRWYLEERFNFHAPERTTEEFLLELQGTTRLTAEQKQSLAQFLESCDLVKFARYEPPETALRELHEAACRLVDETRFEPVAALGRAEVGVR